MTQRTIGTNRLIDGEKIDNLPANTSQELSNITTTLNTKVDKTTTVNGKALNTNITINKSDIGLGNVDNTSDLNKPISTDTQTALDGKVDKVVGKGLSTEDYTTAEKNKVAIIEIGGAGTEFLADDGTYKTIAGGGDVTASGTLTNNTVLLGGGSKTAKTSSKTIVTTLGSDDTTLPTSKAVKDVTDGKVTGNVEITGATKTKITYDSKGLVTAGEDAEISDISGLQEELDSKLDTSALNANIVLYATNTESDISGYSKMVTGIDDPDYNDPAVNIEVGPLPNEITLVGQLVSEPGVLIGNPGIVNITTIGEIRRSQGTGTAHFYYELYMRDGDGIETLMSTSNDTQLVTSETFEGFNASVLLNNGTWTETDRIVIKYYARKISGTGTGLYYEFKFGGGNPVRTLLPVPVSVVPTDLSNYYNKTETDNLLDDKQNILSEGAFVDGDKTKLDNIEAGAEVNEVNSVNGRTGIVTGLAEDNAVVKLSGDQTIAGVKTFSSSPIVPTPTTDMQVATKKYVDDNAGGGGGGGNGPILSAVIAGEITTGTVIEVPVSKTITAGTFRVSLKTLPTGADVIVKLYKNGVEDASVTISTGASATNGLYQGTDTTFVSGSYAAGDVLKVSVTQVGSTLAGTGLALSLTE